MSQLLFAKALKLILSLLTYGGTAVIFMDRASGGDVAELIELNSLQMWLLGWAVFIGWVLKLVWYIVDKRLEYRERIDKLKRSERNDRKIIT